jgi:hypothetical protein
MKPTQKKPTKAEALGQINRPPQGNPGAPNKPGMQGNPGAPNKPGMQGKPGAPKGKLVKTEKPTGLIGVIKSIDPVMIAAGGLILVLLLGAIFYFVFAGNNVETVQPQPQSTVQDEFGDPDPALPVYPADHFLASPAPLQALASQMSEKALLDHPSYAPGMGFSLPDGTVYPEGSPELIALRQELNNRILMDLNSRAQVQVDSETGETVVIARDDTTGQMLPLNTEIAVANFENQAYRNASLAVDNIIAQKSMEARNNNAIQEVPVVEKQVVVESVLTDDEKRKYITLIETQERENQKLRSQMADVQKDMLQQRNQVIDVIQRIENSPAASQRLRASMLPKITGLEQHSIVGDRVWFKDKEGNLTTYSIGEVIDGTSLMISGTDESSGVVLVTPR